jgi:hypothetical protein
MGAPPSPSSSFSLSMVVFKSPSPSRDSCCQTIGIRPESHTEETWRNLSIDNDLLDLPLLLAFVLGLFEFERQLKNLQSLLVRQLNDLQSLLLQYQVSLTLLHSQNFQGYLRFIDVRRDPL